MFIFHCTTAVVCPTKHRKEYKGTRNPFAIELQLGQHIIIISELSYSYNELEHGTLLPKSNMLIA